MEKLFISLISCLLFLSSFSVKAQEYAVFKCNGYSTNTVNKTEKIIRKGNIINKGVISVIEKDTILLLDTNGVFYQLDTDKNYDVSEVSKYQKQKSEEEFSKKYFSYVWKQMRNKDLTSNHTGNVYRDDKINVMISPTDSISIYKNEVVFTWEENKEKEFSYFFLKNINDNTMTTIKVKGNNLSLFSDNKLLVKGKFYSWAIAYEKYPAFDRVKFNSFEYLTQEQYTNSLMKFNSIDEDLKKLGYTNTEIKQFICEYFNLCAD